jgi:hypothetical protein
VQVGSKTVEEPPSPGNGTVYCGSCYGAEQEDHPCCNTCDEVQFRLHVPICTSDSP